MLPNKVDPVKSHARGGLVNGAELDEREILVQVDLAGDHWVASRLGQTAQVHLQKLCVKFEYFTTKKIQIYFSGFSIYFLFYFNFLILFLISNFLNFIFNFKFFKFYFKFLDKFIF